MQVITIIADSAAAAVGQIREQLGPDAIVLNVRQLPPQGLSRLWQRPRIEVLACAGAQKSEELAEMRKEIQVLKEQMPALASEAARFISSAAALADMPAPAAAGGAVGGQWRVARLLESTGMTSLCLGRTLDEMERRSQGQAPAALADEIALAQRVLRDLWSKPFQAKARRRAPLHVFVGPPGAGKTSCLCKWLAQTVLMENRAAEVWRLDGATANTAESLSVYCEILGVPLQRLWQGSPGAGADISFIDLPGVNWCDPASVSGLKAHLEQFSGAQVHLVLNAAYETHLLLAQIKAFSSLPIDDLIFTHLDEELRWGKIWNFVLGTNYSVRFLSAGQNVPGEFCEASAEKILSRQFACK